MSEDTRIITARQEQGDRRMADPCLHSAEIVRMQLDISELRADVRANTVDIHQLSTNDAETKVYMKQVLEGIEKLSKSMESHLLNSHTTPIEINNTTPFIQKLIPQFLDLLKWAILIIAFIVGAKDILVP